MAASTTHYHGSHPGMSQQQDPQSSNDVAPRSRPPLTMRIRYYVDLFMSRSPWSRFLALFVISFCVISFCAVLAMMVSAADSPLRGDYFEAMWWALGRVADAGTMGGDTGTFTRMIAVMATLSGIMVVAVLIGLVSSTVQDKLEDLRRGKSPVIDEDHTLILGFSDKVFPILRELIEANSSKKHASVVILSPLDKVETEELVRSRIDDFRSTRLVMRQGSPFSPEELVKVGADRARGIIILSADVGEEDEEIADPDMNAIKTLLALRRVPGALKGNHAVVELADGSRTSVIEQLGQGGVEVVAMRETLVRLMVQTARQNGLAGVYRDLLGFDGSELYFKNFPALAGATFGEVRSFMRGGIAVGFRRPNVTSGTGIFVNPAHDTKIEAGDELLVLAEDDDTFSADRANPVADPKLPTLTPFSKARSTERILICGYRSDLGHLLSEFDKYVLPGSTVFIMPGPRHEAPVDVEGHYTNFEIKPLDGDPTNPADLKQIEEFALTAILHVANDTIDAEESDACTVISLLIMRDMFAKHGLRPRMISEINDPRTTELVSEDDATDFVVSSVITSMLITQVGEQRGLNAVYADLFSPEGSEIYLKSVERYAPLGTQITFHQLQVAAAQFGETAIGCFRGGTKPVLNPAITEAMMFRAGDKLIVLAEDDSEEVTAKDIMRVAA